MTNAVDLKAMESRLTANFENRFSRVLKAVGAKLSLRSVNFAETKLMRRMNVRAFSKMSSTWVISVLSMLTSLGGKTPTYVGGTRRQSSNRIGKVSTSIPIPRHRLHLNLSHLSRTLNPHPQTLNHPLPTLTWRN